MISFTQINGYPIMIYEKDGKKYYWLAGCPHKKRPLNEGKVFDDKIMCPFHKAVFSLITGELIKEPESKTPCINCRLIKADIIGDKIVFEEEPFIPQLPSK
ncbi:Rieske (2Fe-2S) domain protein [Sulfolobus islandicus Y.G.57.14]|jgi:nitrite reductase/ring-hydroxylating ferredoxin subunit|uniref:Rieske (2Fe-2S) domain protein n=3 Tax=Saccharolobus islandicus TaxID=43080 RepID=C3MNI0_SACI2|nr:Rieske 2Fe-2S domain-containing protein [Sulfolobus islandicus]ACP34943.1 Rieske (2Fe-2S) domain protein [Sulfolobus islandicus L.S.2.15]ACP45236.1 Rieske (2Fe-2S) domain protein [Sulfolobus islandicus Y.G.57.14]ADB86503.1 Rieske (2Fe-2S) domain protein [Sulfolobus islandicus L.D.8.5]